MTTMELIERGVGHNCLSDAYDLGRADKEKELSEHIEELERRVSELESACSALINGYA